MPIFILRTRAEMDFGEAEGEFWPAEGACWTLDVKQSAGDDVRKEVIIDPDEEMEIPNSKDATCNFLIKFEGDTKPAHLTCVKPKGVVFGRQSTSMGPSEWVNWAAFECRGLEPVRWHPTGPYCVQVEGGALYEEMGFTNDEDWCEYDEKTEASLCIGKDVAYEFVLHKEK